MRPLFRSQLAWGCVVALVGLAVGLAGWSVNAQGVLSNHTLPAGGPSSGLITHFNVNETQGVTHVTVIDPQTRVMSVYHIDNTGEIHLRGVRNFRWDLEMEEFNTGKPTPEEIRNGLQRLP